MENVEEKTKFHRKHILRLLTICFLIIAFIVFVYWFFIGRFYVSTDDAYVSGNLVAVMPQTSGQVMSIHADTTDLVKKGQPLVLLDQADALINLKVAQANLAITARQVSQIYLDIAQLRSSVAVQQDSDKRAAEDLKRRMGLEINKTISIEDFQHAQIAASSTANELALAKHRLAAALAIVSNTDLYHHPKILLAATKLADAYLDWRRTTIYAPETGYVGKRPVQVGQQVDPDTVLMVIVPLNQIWVDANFKESQLRNIRIGQSVELTSDAYGSGIKYKGTVVGLSPGTGSTFALLPPQNATGNWIKIVQRVPVRIAVDAKELKKHPLRMGLSMIVTVNTHNRKGEILAQAPTQEAIYQTRDYTQDLLAVNKMIQKILQNNAKDLSANPSTQVAPNDLIKPIATPDNS